MNTPKEYQNVMITYKGTVRYNQYGDHKPAVVTRRAFYSKSDGYYNRKDEWIDTPDGYFSVPQYWQTWAFSDGTSALLPRDFYSYGRVTPDKVISWEVDKTNQ